MHFHVAESLGGGGGRGHAHQDSSHRAEHIHIAHTLTRIAESKSKMNLFAFISRFHSIMPRCAVAAPVRVKGSDTIRTTRWLAQRNKNIIKALHYIFRQEYKLGCQEVISYSAGRLQ
jgi:hypothetical protein